ncbi:hypothetical protein JCM11641_002598 [Rhodosporidiobolus odoratus]
MGWSNPNIETNTSSPAWTTSTSQPQQQQPDESGWSSIPQSTAGAPRTALPAGLTGGSAGWGAGAEGVGQNDGRQANNAYGNGGGRNSGGARNDYQQGRSGDGYGASGGGRGPAPHLQQQQQHQQNPQWSGGANNGGDFGAWNNSANAPRSGRPNFDRSGNGGPPPPPFNNRPQQAQGQSDWSNNPSSGQPQRFPPSPPQVRGGYGVEAGGGYAPSTPSRQDQSRGPQQQQQQQGPWNNSAPRQSSGPSQLGGGNSVAGGTGGAGDWGSQQGRYGGGTSQRGPGEGFGGASGRGSGGGSGWGGQGGGRGSNEYGDDFRIPTGYSGHAPTGHGGAYGYPSQSSGQDSRRGDYGDGGGVSYRGGYGGGGGGGHGGGGGFGPSFGRYRGPFSANIAAVSFENVELPKFQRDFCEPHPNVVARSEGDVAEFRESKKITVVGKAPFPVQSWVEANLPKYIGEYIQRSGFAEPTAIQAQAFPMAMSGNDLIAISETGSGKTLAYALPALMHINAQEPSTPESGPIALVLAPTRELATQILSVFADLGESSEISAVCVYGGTPRMPQLLSLRGGCDVLIATPGRLLDFLEKGEVQLRRVTYLVLDEADRMLHMGFEDEVKMICGTIRPDRQVLMFSATWPREVRDLAKKYLKTASRVHIGNDETHAAKEIQQEVIVCRGFVEKNDRLIEEIEKVKAQQGKVLIFGNTKRAVQDLCDRLRAQRYEALSIHGDKTQEERDFALSEFRTGSHPILTATDVAQRGLDISGVTVVINFDAPKDITDYVHRIGRTGRAGHAGKAVTFLSDRDPSNIVDGIIKVLGQANQVVPDELLNFAGGSSFRSFGGYALAPPSDSSPFAAAAPVAPASVGWGGWGTVKVSSPTAEQENTTSAGGWGLPLPAEPDCASVSSNDTARPANPASTESTSAPSHAPSISDVRSASAAAKHPLPLSPPPSPIEHRSKYQGDSDSGYGLSSPELLLSSSPTTRTTGLSACPSTSLEIEDEGLREPLDSPVTGTKEPANGVPAISEGDQAWLDNFLSNASISPSAAPPSDDKDASQNATTETEEEQSAGRLASEAKGTEEGKVVAMGELTEQD